MPYLARSLQKLRGQINYHAPKRSKRSDGWIGDQAHRNRRSDHNPNMFGAVTAIDVTHDPRQGCDAQQIADQLAYRRDPRIKYLIWDRRILRAYNYGRYRAWDWNPYGGSNPHTKHIHISVRPEPEKYNLSGRWLLDLSPAQPNVLRKWKERKVNILKKGARGHAIKDIQRALAENGYRMVGKPDGIFGSKTRLAVTGFQKDSGLKTTGEVDGVTAALLLRR